MWVRSLPVAGAPRRTAHLPTQSALRPAQRTGNGHLHRRSPFTQTKCHRRGVSAYVHPPDTLLRRGAALHTQNLKRASGNTWRQTDILGQASAQVAQNESELDRPSETPHCTTSPTNDSVYVALGSNVGDRLEAIEAACRAIDEDQDMRVLRTSALYETEPMYVEDQERFLNGVCEVSRTPASWDFRSSRQTKYTQIQTELPPLRLLDRLQALEKGLGRVKTIDKGPRSIDLDILLYKGQEYHDERLTIPHALMTEREFVMRPLRK